MTQHTTKGTPVREKPQSTKARLRVVEEAAVSEGVPPEPRAEGAVYLCEALSLMNEGAGFLDRLRLDEIAALRRYASPMNFEPGESIFVQGDLHRGILLIEEGRVRIYYASPSGKEITLAYWTPGHFIGGPEVFGGGLHMWSAEAIEPSRLSYLPAGKLRHLASTVPAIALALIDGLVAKGKCYSALVQMLGTRSVTERLAQLLLVLASAESADPYKDTSLIVDRRITHEQLASIVGSTRQWVTSTLARFQREKIIRIERNVIYIDRPDALPLQS